MSIPLVHLPIIPLENNVASVTYLIFTKPLPENCFLYQFTVYIRILSTKMKTVDYDIIGM